MISYRLKMASSEDLASEVHLLLLTFGFVDHVELLVLLQDLLDFIFSWVVWVGGAFGLSRCGIGGSLCGEVLVVPELVVICFASVVCSVEVWVLLVELVLIEGLEVFEVDVHVIVMEAHVLISDLHRCSLQIQLVCFWHRQQALIWRIVLYLSVTVILNFVLVSLSIG